MTYTIRSILIVVVVCAVIAAMVASEVHRRLQHASEDRQTMVAYLVCDYLIANTNQWPPSWDALEPYFVSRYQKDSHWKFDEIKSDILLDFEIDGPTVMGIAINAEKSRAFQAIESISDAGKYIERDPNQIVLDHFRSMISY